MDSNIEYHLTTIEDNLAKGQGERPERLLTELINQMGMAELTEWRQDILKIVEKFQKKRRNRLIELIDRSTEVNSERDKSAAEGNIEEFLLPSKAELVSDLENTLQVLHDRHIYQWSTYYYDYLSEQFEIFFEFLKRTPPDDICLALVEPFAHHSCSIFTHGYEYGRERRAHSEAIQKSLGGLSSFLELPLSYYSARTSSVSDCSTAVALRLLMSATICGILEGYSSAKFGNQTGRELLPVSQRKWVHYLAFLTPQHAERIANVIDNGPLRTGIRTSVLPMLDSIQAFFTRSNDDYFPMPIVGQYALPQRRLDVIVRPPRHSESQRWLEGNAFLEEGFVSTTDLTDAIARQVKIIVAPLRPDIASMVEEQSDMGSVVVPTSLDQRELVAARAFQKWDDATFALRSRRVSSSPITYNFAREFPLRDPNKARFFHVTRTSVRDLLRTFERRNGVRLWCSVRRSGKTTACFDLSSSTEESQIVSQTCGAPTVDGANLFYKAVLNATQKREHLSESFVADVISKCAPLGNASRRTVLIIDEYETLFGMLKASVVDDPVVRYSVVQPILNQLMEFSMSNLLVFLGQQPDAHFILMDQNQLAPYVEQDSFPLFEHRKGTVTGEFAELLRKIFGDRIDCSAQFMDAVFEETAGHPYLTANVLGEFVDWLIEQKRPQHGLRVDDKDFSKFARSKLGMDRIALSNDYEFFRSAAATAMSNQGYIDNPWLYTIYWVLRLLSETGSSNLRVKLSDFENLIERIPVPGNNPLPTKNEILRTASHGNFIRVERQWVGAKIKTLGRIAASVRPALA